MIKWAPMMLSQDLSPALQYGVQPRDGGVEFRLFSRHATAVILLLYSNDDPQGGPIAEIALERTGDVWHGFLPNLQAGALYAYRVEGPHDPEHGHRFDPQCVLLDPYARAMTTNASSADASATSVTAHPTRRPRCVVVEDHFDWRNTARPHILHADTIIYETHLRGMTAHPSAGARDPGTYLGFIEKLDYLRDLGVTAVELLPIHEFDPHENPLVNPLTNQRLVNYWGYSTVGFFAPAGRYAVDRRPGAAVDEFRTLVREAHHRGIEVILDVVYNHTAEGNHTGPVLNLKGLDNSIYYHLNEDRRFYKDFSGCGNSVNCNHPVVRQMILDSLRCWVTKMGVDGFRFDLASVLSRDCSGALVDHAPLLEEIAEDPMLRDAKIIAEAWDAAGAYQVGSFPGGRWAEWNGRYRDDVRQFWRGDSGKTGALATRLMGSSDLYQPSGRKPWHSVNFVTSHDGFTLRDLASYNGKHNEANGEDNRDGDNNNICFNFGVEGPTDDLRINGLRLRHSKNLLATMLLSQGVPMILGGDEFGRSQLGNNNAYCQDNEVSWFDWRLLETNSEFHRFVRELIWFRRRRPIFRRANFFQGRRNPGRAIADVNWYGADAGPKDWHFDDHTLICLLDGLPQAGMSDPPDDDVLILFNAGFQTRQFILAGAESPERPWQLVFDTGNRSPRDFYAEGSGPRLLPGSGYPLIERSMACFSRPHG